MTFILRPLILKSTLKKTLLSINYFNEMRNSLVHTSKSLLHGEYEMQDPKTEADM